MPTLLFLSPYSVVPPRYGGPLRVYNLCRQVSRSFTVLEFAQQTQRSNLRPSLKPVETWVTPHYLEYSTRNPANLMLYYLSSIRWLAPPFWQSSVLKYTAPRWLKQQVQHADVIHVEHPWQFEWVHNQVKDNTPIILGTPNVEAELYPLEYLHAIVPVSHYIVREIERLERFALGNATRILAVSEEDAARLSSRYQISLDRFSVIPNGVDCSKLVPADSELRRQRKQELGFQDRLVIVFAGSMHRPNIEAVKQIIAWAEAWPDTRCLFLIVGTVGRLFSQVEHPLVHVTGAVESTQPFFESSDIAINPVASGSGTNLKQLEFMAMGLPTVTTPTGARGFLFSDSRQVFIRDLVDFPAQIEWLSQHPEIREQVGQAARAAVEDLFDWSNIGSRLIEIYEQVMS